MLDNLQLEAPLAGGHDGGLNEGAHAVSLRNEARDVLLQVRSG